MQTIRKHAARRPLHALRALALVPAGFALGACTSDELSLGAGDGPLGPDGTACAYGEDGIVTGDVTAQTQEEIDALAGCEQVLGDLTIFGSSAFNLHALASLRIVRGGLKIGITRDSLYSNANGGDSDGDGIAESNGKVASLAGLEALEEVRSLGIANLLSTDLLPLSRLRSVYGSQPGRPGQLNGGTIGISDCPNLVDLTGLESSSEWTDLFLSQLPALASLKGIGMPGMVISSVSVSGAPALADLSSLAQVKALGALTLNNTGLESLGDLSLQTLDVLRVEDNPRLTDMDGAFREIQSVRSLSVLRNPKLDHLPRMRGVDTFQVIDNAELRSIPIFESGVLHGYSLGLGGGHHNPDSNVAIGDDFTVVEIANNPKLSRFDVPLEFAEGNYVGIYGNASLTEINLRLLSNVDVLSIRDNPVLSSLDLGDFGAAEVLSVQNNPGLSVAGLSEVKAFERVVENNADAP
jgi:hypothetical protein